MSETPQPDGTMPPDTAGPDATPDQDAAVRSLLGMLHADDIPMPDDVIRRIDAALALERRSAGALAGSPLATTASADAGRAGTEAFAGTHDHLASVTVLPARRGPSTRTFKILGGVAAAGVIGLVGVAALSNGLGGGGATSTSAGAAISAPASQPEAAGTAADKAGTVIASTGATYTVAGLSKQVGALVSTRAYAGPQVAATPSALGTAPTTALPSPGGAVAQSPALATPVDGTTSNRATGPLSSSLPFTESTLAACLAQLTDRRDTRAMVVDRGTYQGKPADVVVIPTREDPRTLDVWVLAPGCGTTASVDVHLFAHVPAP